MLGLVNASPVLPGVRLYLLIAGNRAEIRPQDRMSNYIAVDSVFELASAHLYFGIGRIRSRK